MERVSGFRRRNVVDVCVNFEAFKIHHEDGCSQIKLQTEYSILLLGIYKEQSYRLGIKEIIRNVYIPKECDINRKVIARMQRNNCCWNLATRLPFRR
jgi:hypothetical protein